VDKFSLSVSYFLWHKALKAVFIVNEIKCAKIIVSFSGRNVLVQSLLLLPMPSVLATTLWHMRYFSYFFDDNKNFGVCSGHREVSSFKK